MKCLIMLAFLAAAVLAVQSAYCGSIPECGEGMCCTGGSFNRHCQSLADEGRPCQKKNSLEKYSTNCPCKEGLICSVINYCQKA